jgi:hypothetical protein
LAKSTGYEVPHYVVFSNLLSLHPSSVKKESKRKSTVIWKNIKYLLSFLISNYWKRCQSVGKLCQKPEDRKVVETITGLWIYFQWNIIQ